MEAIRWRLIYADGRSLDELPDGSTILETWSGASELHLIDKSGRAFMRVPLEGWNPIFYRQRSMKADTAIQAKSMALGGGVSFGIRSVSPPRLDAVVFGRGREGSKSVDVQLWAVIDGKVIDCPQRHIAMGAIRHQVERGV